MIDPRKTKEAFATTFAYEAPMGVNAARRS